MIENRIKQRNTIVLIFVVSALLFITPIVANNVLIKNNTARINNNISKKIERFKTYASMDLSDFHPSVYTETGRTFVISINSGFDAVRNYYSDGLSLENQALAKDLIYFFDHIKDEDFDDVIFKITYIEYTSKMKMGMSIRFTKDGINMAIKSKISPNNLFKIHSGYFFEN